RPVSTSFIADSFQQGASHVRRRLGGLWRRGGPAGAGSARRLTDPRFRQRVEEYLSSDAFPSEVFDRGLIRRTLQRHFEGGDGLANAVSTLLTVAEGSRLFIEQRPEEPPAEVEPYLGPVAATGISHSGSQGDQ
ncbi:MAG: hypothetical protein KAX19_07125, partial [Candidatus Brocadiae bacterium]|nr:hypothetical protein [Candidatus Brocadiia bacterium]